MVARWLGLPRGVPLTVQLVGFAEYGDEMCREVLCSSEESAGP